MKNSIVASGGLIPRLLLLIGLCMGVAQSQLPAQAAPVITLQPVESGSERWSERDFQRPSATGTSPLYFQWLLNQQPVIQRHQYRLDADQRSASSSRPVCGGGDEYQWSGYQPAGKVGFGFGIYSRHQQYFGTGAVGHRRGLGRFQQ